MTTISCDPRTGIYYFRRAIPEALRPFMDRKREYKVSLRTKDPDEAKARQPAHAAECERQFGLARKRLAAARMGEARGIVDQFVDTREPETPAADATFLAVMELLSHALNLNLPVPNKILPLVSELDFGEPPSLDNFLDHQRRARMLVFGEPGSEKPMGETIQRLRNSRNYQPLKHTIERIGEFAGVDATYGTEMFDALAEAYTERMLAALSPDDFDYDRILPPVYPAHTPRPAAAAALQTAVTPDTPPEHRLSAVYEDWATAQLEKKQTEHDKTVDEWRRSIRQFIDMHGNLDVNDITSAMVREYRKVLQRKPKNAKKDVECLPLREQARIAAEEDLPRIAPASVNKALSAIRVTLEYARDVLEILRNDENVAAGVKSLPTSEFEDYRLPFDDADLQAIFRHPVVVDSTGISSHTLLWMLLLGAYTGCRLSEIGHLRPSNIRKDQGIWFIAIERDRKRKRAAEGAQKSVKTNNSLRDIPVHSFLIEIGFLEFAAGRRDQPWLFPDLDANKYGSRTARASRVLNDYLDGLGITDPEKVFHSFRHLIRRRMRGRVIEEIADLIAGHDSASVGRRYGRGADLPILRDAIETISYDTVDWEPTRKLLKQLQSA